MSGTDEWAGLLERMRCTKQKLGFYSLLKVISKCSSGEWRSRQWRLELVNGESSVDIGQTGSIQMRISPLLLETTVSPRTFPFYSFLNV